MIDRNDFDFKEVYPSKQAKMAKDRDLSEEFENGVTGRAVGTKVTTQFFSMHKLSFDAPKLHHSSNLRMNLC